jgi:RNA polymerase sigma factor (sigma-70 family)
MSRSQSNYEKGYSGFLAITARPETEPLPRALQNEKFRRLNWVSRRLLAYLLLLPGPARRHLAHLIDQRQMIKEGGDETETEKKKRRANFSRVELMQLRDHVVNTGDADRSIQRFARRGLWRMYTEMDISVILALAEWLKEGHEAKIPAIKKARRLLREADELVEELILRNMRLMYKFVTEHLRRTGEKDYDTWLSEGMIGLREAVLKFDPDMGNQFATLACWWITFRVKREQANKRSVIRIPIHIQEQLLKLRRAEDKATSEGGRDDAWIAREAGMSLSHVRELRKHRHNMVHLDAEIEDDEGSTGTVFGAMIGDDGKHGEEMVTTIDRQDNMRRIQQAVNELPEEQRAVVARRLGLPSYKDAYAALFELSQTRSRKQAKKDLVNGLRNLSRPRYLQIVVPANAGNEVSQKATV